MRSIYRTVTFLVVLLSTVIACDGKLTAATFRVVDTLEIDTVPSWFPVRFCLLTHGQQQYVAYYNQKHQMVVAQRQVGQRNWQKVELPTHVGWDSHNYVTMAVDAAGCLHVAGNMHCVPLIYFRSQKRADITTLKQLPMTGEEEQRCTYPRFLTDADGNLLFNYRSGRSGNGKRLYNRYDVDNNRWSRFLDTPLFEGQGKRNAYPEGPQKGPDGLFHMAWVWRDTPDCATNHHLSYARSRDLKHWETAAGKPVELPLTLEQTELWVDPIPVNGGIINGCEKLAFDSEQRPILAYHKLDKNGHMQIFVARFEVGQWKNHAITAWEKNIQFGGGGSMPFIGISIGRLEKLAPDKFFISYRHNDYGSGRVVLRDDTLEPIDEKVTIVSPYPRELRKPTLTFEGLVVRMAEDLGVSYDPRDPRGPDTRFVLRWETLGPNRDRPRDPPLPPASTLKLVTLERTE